MGGSQSSLSSSKDICSGDELLSDEEGVESSRRLGAMSIELESTPLALFLAVCG